MDVRAAGSPSTIGWSTCRNSAKRARRSPGVQGPWPSAVASGPSLPGPSPRSRRPPLTSSSASASRASVTGWRKLGVATRVPSRMRWVTAAAAASTGTAACHGPSGMPPQRTWSYVQAVQNPTRSAHSHWRRASLQRSEGRMTRPMRTTLNLYVVAVANERETKRWNDDRWVAAWPDRERLTEALTPFVLTAAAARSGMRVCDIGCGGGLLTIALAGAVAPGGRAVGLDVSAPPPELAGGRARQAGAENVEFVVVDAQTGRLGQEPFDLAVSPLGGMFF